jgi:hypothetical protein
MKSKVPGGVRALAIAASLLASSIVTSQPIYAGSETTADKPARIEAASGISLESCDGKRISSLSIKVPPGQHIVEMSVLKQTGGFVTQRSADTCFLAFAAEEGHVYRVDATPPSNGMYAGFVTDRTTGQQVTSGCVTPPGMEDMKLKEIETAISRQRDNAHLWMNKGRILGAARRYEEALTAFDTATSLKPDLVDGWGWKGRTLYELKRYEDALKALDRAAALRPGDPEAVKLKKTITVAMESDRTKEPKAPNVVFDGKKMLFPSTEAIPPTDISEVHFDLKSVPDERKFLVGKVYRAQFQQRGVPVDDGLSYTFLTQWKEHSIEMFYWPISTRVLKAFPSAKPFLDCTPLSFTEYKCTRRGVDSRMTYEVTFAQEQISVAVSNGWEAELVAAGEIPQDVTAKTVTSVQKSESSSSQTKLNWDESVKKINALGDLRDKGLISQEDYDRKKGELLKSF